MTLLPRAVRRLALLLPLALLTPSATAQQALPAGAPESLQTGDEVPWIYRGSDVPRDKEWLFGEMDNGLRYAVRKNGVPPRQVSIRIRMDAGSLHERDDERGFAHLMEHLSFRESKYLGPAMAIPTWQRLGATFGSDTNAETTPTQTVYKLDLPNATPQALEESFKLLSGMIREPVLNERNLAAEVPIVLAEKRERGGAAERVVEGTRKTLFAGQPLAERMPIGTEETLTGATAQAVQAFHDRWYRPENTVIVAAGDIDPVRLAQLVEQWFGDWQGKGPHVEAPNFGDPVPPPGATGENPVGETAVLVEPDLPRSLTYAIMRPWRKVDDTIEYNEGLLLDSLSQALINRRLEARARAGGSYLYAQVQQDDVSRSTDATFVTVAPLSEDWEAALTDVRAVIADALATPPSQEEIAREMAEFDVVFASMVEQRAVMAGSKLADDIVTAVDIRETVAAPETVLSVFRGMKEKFTPEAVLEHTRALFSGDVMRSVYVTPATGEADAAALKTALEAEVAPDPSARLDSSPISFEDLPPIGEPGQVVDESSLGLLGIERIELDNGVTAILWPNDAEPGRVAVRVRFGAGFRGFDEDDAVYRALGEAALVQSGVGELGQEELDRISTGRKMAFNFEVEDAAFTFSAQTRNADLADQLYLFAAKLAMPRWDGNPVLRAKAAARLAYESYSTSPSAVLNRDLEYYLRDRDPRYATPDLAMLEGTTPEKFREVWEPLLEQGPIEVAIFGEFDRAAALEALRNTFGALPERTPIPAEIAARTPDFPAPSTDTVVLHHRGDANQAAAVIAWPTGGGVERLPESRQLEILANLFSNRLIDAMRERAGASYAPQVMNTWPVDLQEGGRLTAIAQLRPQDVPAFFAAADEIAADLAANPPTEDELARVTEPLRQLINRASTGNTFWMYQLEGSTRDPRRVQLVRSLLNDYTVTTPQAMQQLAQRHLAARPGFRLAVIPQGQELVRAAPGSEAEVAGR
ncbi:M16 family metallopeptidase [Pelagerythrobacter rhizovicinus]|uniref:Insulinase family protein n=1 Tax=Pelagerythrobacter rhizovicinus TaxID=2268576 RepID=A0A4Q2KQ12_9SPHN|nr:insulinase family protein [Pelagerythrobacter rhizovicinus]RXZ65712.1 insulinase family protein [Pelagerythrobacter rhizovicinus]